MTNATRSLLVRRSLPIILAALALAGCGNESPTEPSGPVTRSELLVSTEWLAARLTDPSVVVVHVGSDATFRAGHVPGAKFLAFASLAVERNGLPAELPDLAALEAALEGAGISDGKHVVLYGDMSGLAAARAFFTLEYVGHPKASLLDGGLEAWKAESRAVETTAPTTQQGSLAVRANAELLVTGEWILSRLQDPSLALIDARQTAEYVGDVAGHARITRPGHIPGAGSFPWRTALVSTTDLRLKDPETLRTMLTAAGADFGETTVTYCSTGVQSSMSYFIARYVGYSPKLYDGSFVDWNLRAEYPVAKCATPRCG